MGVLSDRLYTTDFPYGEADVLARKIVRQGTRVAPHRYRYHGTVYWVVAGRVLTREEGERLAAERKREGLS